MKKILGLDLGTTSIGWALVNEAENAEEKSSIIKLGVRVNPLTVDEQTNFEKGNSITTNADRTLKRSMRRNLQRYKLRREQLIDCLKENGIISDDTILHENGNASTFHTYRQRAKAAEERITLEDFARVLLMINKKRGYKSSRKANSQDEGQLIDGMEIAKKLYEEQLTPGQYSLSLLQQGRRYTPDYYRSDLIEEFNRIWDVQKPFYPNLLTNELRQELWGRGKIDSSKFLFKKHEVTTAKVSGKEKRMQGLLWRVEALKRKLEEEELAYVLCDLNGEISSSSGYLGAISDRSKELYFNRQTIGQYLMTRLDENPNNSLTNIVFYRQDYLDEFEIIWEKQAEYYSQLTPKLKHEIRDIIIFYQRPLKSQKGKVAFCELEHSERKITTDGKKRTILTGSKVCPKSSPLFQEFKIWQVLNNLQVSLLGRKRKKIKVSANELSLFSQEEMQATQRFLSLEEKQILYAELCTKDKLSKKDALNLLYKNAKELDLNYKEIEGNRTMATFFKSYQEIISMTGNGEYDFSKMPASKAAEIVTKIFKGLGYKTDFLYFDSSLDKKAMEQQPSYRLWHLLYSYVDDNSKTGDEKLIERICELTGFEPEYAQILAKVSFAPDYGSLSAKAIRKILPFMMEGNTYSEACLFAGYNHSVRSLTKEQIKNKVYKDHLELLKRNALRNPVVEKILNQMINVVNMLVDTYGKPDEIRIEMARELKKSQQERKDMTDAINKNTTEAEKIRQLLQKDFGISHPSRNDIIRYRLYEELRSNGYHTIYSNTYISREQLFSDKFDIEHIIPQARLFDDSFSNKTLEARDINIEKGKATAFDFVNDKYGEEYLEQYEKRIDDLVKCGAISRTKQRKLLMSETEIPTDFIERDLRNTQYIARQALEMLNNLVPSVVATTGAITDKLRDDWQLVDVMKELNWDKYDKLGLTESYEDKNGQQVKRIKDWTKRNDHRHHAMDALTVAFTKRSIIQYLNNLNARSDKGSSIYGIEQKETEMKNGHRVFRAPILPLGAFRMQAKEQLESILVSIKAKNKVVTENINKSKRKGDVVKKKQLTPRGQLHLETVYGRIMQPENTSEKVGSSFDAEKIAHVSNPRMREALMSRLNAYDGDAKKAFTGKNSLEKNPLYLDDGHHDVVPAKVPTTYYKEVFTIRKKIDKDLKLDKVIDSHVRDILIARLEAYGGDAAKAFSSLDKNPIWLNEEKGIAIKRVTIRGISNGTPIHEKRDVNGEKIRDAEGHAIPNDYVNTGNNHHIAFFVDETGILQEHVVSFFEATARAQMGYPIVDKEYNSEAGWKFVFSMKQNEYFVFPNEQAGFNPNEIDLTNPDNYAIISPNLFRVQKFSNGDYFFRHHLETNVEDKKELKDIAWKRLSRKGLYGIVKVRVNHIGQIVDVGEY